MTICNAFVDFLSYPTSTRRSRAWWSTSTSFATPSRPSATLCPAEAGLLRRLGQSGAGSPALFSQAWAPISIARLSPKSKWRSMPARPSARISLRQHDQEGARHCPRPCTGGSASSPSIAMRKSKRFRVQLPAHACSGPRADGRRRCRNGPLCRVVRLRAARWPSTFLSTPTSLAQDSYGVSFHVGSQMTKLDAWDAALADAKRVFVQLAKQGINLKMVNMGGGFPTRYLRDVPPAEAYGKAIFGAAEEARLRQPHPAHAIIEPGRRHGRQCRRDQGRKSF